MKFEIRQENASPETLGADMTKHLVISINLVFSQYLRLRVLSSSLNLVVETKKF